MYLSTINRIGKWRSIWRGIIQILFYYGGKYMLPKDFYPTPKELLDKITEGIDWAQLQSVLEPSAGKGDIVDYVKEKYKKATWGRDMDIDCIEIDNSLCQTLKGKGLRVVHNDFLTFKTFKHYDLILMNPPFSDGAKHLLHALSLQKDNFGIICILNAETIRNPYTNERKDLISKLEEINAEIEYMEGQFLSSERPTGVEIAVIKVFVPEGEKESFIFENLKKRSYRENVYEDATDLAPNDFIKAIVQKYNIEVEAGINFIMEYKAMAPHILQDLKDSTYNKPILEMQICDKELSTNAFVKEVRRKYWTALFSNSKFTGKMTSNLADKYYKQVAELTNYDFSEYNIRTIQIEMSKNLVRGIEDCIIELFDKLSYQYAYSDELSKNIHYYNGWKTNKAWYINKKVILPYMNAFSSWNREFNPDYQVVSQLADIEKALNYLDGGLTDGRDMKLCLKHAVETGQTRKIRLKYFYVTFYKKGTCHIEFINEDLLKKLNIFGSQQKKWLPPGYGKKTYGEMQPEEKAVIDDFEGKEKYGETLMKQDYFIYNSMDSIQCLGVNTKEIA